MSLPLTQDTTYLIGRWLHWLAAFVFLVMLIGTDLWSDYADSSDQREVLDYWHIGLGMSFVLLLFFRIGWVIRYPERRTRFDSHWQAVAARSNHWALYILMILVPLSGILSQLFAGDPISLFGNLPLHLTDAVLDINEGILADDMAEYGEEFHLILKWPIYALLSFHIVGALSHWLGSIFKRRAG